MRVPVTVSQLAIAPVKGMRLHAASEIGLGQHGVIGDREFLVIGEDGKLPLTPGPRRHSSRAALCRHQQEPGLRYH
jgi:uncharacterized protein YcbX